MNADIATGFTTFADRGGLRASACPPSGRVLVLGALIAMLASTETATAQRARSGAGRRKAPSRSPDGGAAKPVTKPADNSTVVLSFYDNDRRRPSGEWRTVDARGMPFAEALRVRVAKRPAQPGSIGARGALAGPIKKGEAVLVRFYLRAIDTRPGGDEATVVVRLVKANAPARPLLERTVSAGADWRRIDTPLRATEALPAGAGLLMFQMGASRQTLDIGGAQVVNHGAKVDPGDLPATPISYEGRDADAPWRAVAEAEIERSRKDGLTVTVVDAAGHAVEGATVTVRLLRHTYAFASVIHAQSAIGVAPQDVQYRAKALESLNAAATIADLDWGQWANPNNRTRALAALDWMKANDLPVYAGELVPSAWGRVAKDVSRQRKDPVAVRQAVRAHIAEKASAVAGLVHSWEIVGEPQGKHELRETLGDRALVEWFRVAREADPTATLYLGAAGLFAKGGVDEARLTRLEETVRYLLAHGAPIDGLGVQARFGWALTPPQKIAETLDRLAAFDLPIRITQLDIAIGDEASQADYLRDVLTVAFAHPATDGVALLGFWDARHPKSAAPLYRKNWSIKPAGEVWLDLTRRQWSTDAEGLTDRRGRWRIRGFLGQYEIEVVRGGAIRKMETTLTRGGRRVEIELRRVKGEE